MPRRRRPRCKVRPLIALRTAPIADSDGSQEEPLDSTSEELEVPLASHVAHDMAASHNNNNNNINNNCNNNCNMNSGHAHDWEYKLFPELHNQLPCLPTFSDVFGQHSDVIYQQHATAASTASSSTSASTSASASASASASGSASASASACSSTSASNLLPDLFGLAGLVANLRATRNNVNAMQLATGEDLTTFGLDLASQGDIYVHFNGPFTQQPAGRSSANCALELGMRGMRDAMDKYPTRPPVWDPFVPETRNLGLL
ncbi:hypothetical protein KR222_005924, partial [Zaprionus bogoriensis]